MATPEIKEARIVDAKTFVGAAQTPLYGAGDQDYFSIALSGDIGSAVAGVQGDVMLVQRQNNLYVVTYTFLGASQAVTTLLQLAAIGSAFPFKVSYNDFSLLGWANVQSVGEWVASVGTTSRTIVLNVAKVSGATDKSIGRTLQLGVA